MINTICQFVNHSNHEHIAYIFIQHCVISINCTGVDHFLIECDSLRHIHNDFLCQSIGMTQDTVRFDEFGLAISELLGSFAQLPEPLLVSFLHQLFVALLHALPHAVAALWQVALALLVYLLYDLNAPLVIR